MKHWRKRQIEEHMEKGEITSLRFKGDSDLFTFNIRYICFYCIAEFENEFQVSSHGNHHFFNRFQCKPPSLWNYFLKSLIMYIYIHNQRNCCSELMLTNENPEKSAGILSLISFWWVQKLFTAGNDHPLTEEDVYPIETRLHCERLTALLEQ